MKHVSQTWHVGSRHQDSSAIPICLDDAEPPFGLRSIQAIQFQDWSDDSGDERVDKLISAIRRIGVSVTPRSVLPEQTDVPKTSRVPRFFRNFFDKTKGKRVALTEFPNLFRMEGHTGMFGVVFTSFWFWSAASSVPELRTEGLFVFIKWGIIVNGLFFFLALGSFLLAGSYSKHQIPRPIGRVNA